MEQTCTSMGYKISPYLIVEAHLISCGGFATNGKGPFEPEKLLEWLKKRENKILPVKPTHTLELNPKGTAKDRYNTIVRSF